MGAFSHLLTGLLSGASETYSKQLEEQKKQKQRQDELMASSMEDRLKNDPNLTPDDQVAILQQVGKLRGFDNKTIQAMTQASGYLRRQVEEQQRQKQFSGPQPGIDISRHERAPEAGLEPSLSNLPQQVTRPGAAFPDIPNMPQRTVGDIATEKESALKISQTKQLAHIQSEIRRTDALGNIEDKLAIAQKYKGTPLETQVFQMLNMTPRTTMAPGIIVPGVMRGSKLIEVIKAQGGDPTGIDPSGAYKTVLGSDRKTINSFFPTEDTTVAGGKAVIGSLLINSFPKDAFDNPTNPGGMYVVVRNQAGGKPIEIIPETELATYSKKNSVQFVEQSDGSIRAVPFTESSVAQKVVPGAGTGGLGAIPSPPAGVLGTPKSAATIPSTPTIPTAPKTPTPVAQQTGGPPGPPGSTIVGAKSVNIPEGTVSKITAQQDLIREGEEIQKLLPKVKRIIGPLAGALSGLSFNHLGGYGLTNDEIAALTRIRDFVATKAFEQGGKTLPMGEQAIYTKHLPHEGDTPVQLIEKLKFFLPRYKKDLENQLRGLTGNERKQLERGQGASPTPNTPLPGGPTYTFSPGLVASDSDVVEAFRQAGNDKTKAMEILTKAGKTK